MSQPTTSERRWLLPVGLALLVVTLVVIALTRGPVELDPDTPEGTVQEYLVAIDEGRWEDALAVVHEAALGNCGPEDLSSFASFDFSAELGNDTGGLGGVVVREGFDDISSGQELGPVPAGETLIDVTIRRDDGGGFGSGWNEVTTFELADEEDFWWIVGDPWPYFVWNCR